MSARLLVVLVFSDNDDPNDGLAIKTLIEALCPALKGKVKYLRRPIVLSRNADEAKRRKRAIEIAGQVRIQSSTNDVRCVFVHRDCDAVEPAHVEHAEELEKSLRDLGVPAHAVVPAWELEAWWFLFPEAVSQVCSAWRTLAAYRGKDVGQISNAKEALRRAVRPPGRGRREYMETDSPLIAQQVQALGLARRPSGQSKSYARFREAVDQCCAG